ncbi:MAG: maleylpyruvate isomerase family mycothiol-dependent enzyme [Acidobacteria bacterium]|nr:maleylpyruvate isomerase family mycothiol-dependent enzyme [Acidobacteriota bacterium]
MSSDAPILISLYRRLHDGLAARVGSLSPVDLKAQSYCADWTVAQVLSHLGSGAEIGLGVLAAVVAGEDLPGQEANVAIWDAWNAKSPETQAADFVTADEKLVQRWEALGDDEIGAIHLERFGMQLDGPALVLMRLSEVVLHAWDVEVTFDDGATLDAEAVPWLLDRVPLLAARMARPDAGGLAGARLVVATTDPAASYELDLGDPVTMTVADPSTAAADVALPAEALIRLAYGRLDPGHTPAGAVLPDGLRKVFGPV